MKNKLGKIQCNENKSKFYAKAQKTPKNPRKQWNWPREGGTSNPKD